MEERSLVALEKFAPQVELIDTSNSIYDYNEAIASRWTGKEDLVVIEHDKEITADVIPSFSACSCYWCSYSYFIYPKIMEREVEIGLGCARYSAKLQKLIDPKEFLCEDPVIFGMSCEICGGKGCWKFLDARMANTIRGHGINVHCHGRINHHHDYGRFQDLDSYEIAEIQLRRVRLFKDNLPTDLAGPNW
jgi:hypothetical protein